MGKNGAGGNGGTAQFPRRGLTRMWEQTLVFIPANASFVDNLIDMIVFPPNESSETHIIRER
jgi:hypothetical protein